MTSSRTTCATFSLKWGFSLTYDSKFFCVAPISTSVSKSAWRCDRQCREMGIGIACFWNHIHSFTQVFVTAQSLMNEHLTFFQTKQKPTWENPAHRGQRSGSCIDHEESLCGSRRLDQKGSIKNSLVCLHSVLRVVLLTTTSPLLFFLLRLPTTCHIRLTA